MDHLDSDDLRRLLVQSRPVSVLEGGSTTITDDHIDNSPLKQAINHVVRPAVAENLDIFFVVRETPINGVFQVTLFQTSIETSRNK